EGHVGPSRDVQATAVLDDLLEDDSVAALRRKTHSAQLSPMVVAIERVVLPLRDQVARVEGGAGWSELRIHNRDRIYHAGFVFIAVRGPSVIATPDDHVQLVVVARPILGCEYIVTQRIEVEAPRVPQSVRPDSRLRAGLSDERIVVRSRTVRIDPQHLS